MSKASLMPAIGAGFEVIRREPFAVLIWGLIATALSLLPNLIGFAIVGPSMFSLGSGKVDPAMLESMMAGNAIQSTFGLVAWVASTAILTPAIYRAVLTPSERRNFFMRWGRTEFHMAVLSLVMGVIFIVAAFAVVLILAIPLVIVFAVGAAAGIGAGAGAVAIGFIAGLAIFVALLWVFARLWMAAPMTVVENHLRLFEGWALTKGYGWALVGVNVLLLLIVFLFYVIAGVAIAVVFAGAGFSAASLSGSGLAASLLTLGVLVGVPLLVIIVSIVQVLFAAPWAKAYQIIALATGRTAQTVFD